MRTQACLFFLVMACSLPLVGCGGQKDAPPAQDKKAPTPDKNPAAKIEPPTGMVLTADELGKDLENDPKATHQKYQGKEFELTGIVRGMVKTLSAEPVIMLNAQGAILSVECFTSENEPWNKATPGQTVRMKGGFKTDKLGETKLMTGAILEVKGPPASTLTADELAKAFEIDPAKARDKYAGVPIVFIVLTGEVAEIKQKGKDDLPRARLKTTGKYAVTCRFNPEDQKIVKAGMKLQLTGFCLALAEDKEVAVGDCVLMKVLK